MIDELKKTFGTLTRSLEILYLLNGLKPAVRIDAEEIGLEKISGFCNKNELALEKSDFKVVKIADENKSGFSNKGIRVSHSHPEKGVFHLYIAKSEEIAQKAKLLEKTNNDRNLGELLGYPKCCVDFFVKNKIAQAKNQMDFVISALENSKGIAFPFYNNIAARYFDVTLLSHFPCNFNCKKSAEIAKKNLECIRKYSRGYADMIEGMLKNAVLYTETEGVFVLKEYGLEKNTLHYSKIIASVNNHVFDVLKSNKELLIKDGRVFTCGIWLDAKLMVFT